MKASRCFDLATTDCSEERCNSIFDMRAVGGPRKAPDCFPCRVPYCGQSIAIFACPSERVNQGIKIPRSEHHPLRTSKNIHHCRSTGCNDRQAASHRFTQHQSEALRIGGKNEDVGPLVMLAQLSR